MADPSVISRSGDLAPADSALRELLCGNHSGGPGDLLETGSLVPAGFR